MQQSVKYQKLSNISYAYTREMCQHKNKIVSIKYVYKLLKNIFDPTLYIDKKTWELLIRLFVKN